MNYSTEEDYINIDYPMEESGNNKHSSFGYYKFIGTGFIRSDKPISSSRTDYSKPW